MTKTKVFISRKLGPDSPFKKGLDPTLVEIIDFSLIQFSPLDFDQLESQWLFFYSKSGVKYFIDQKGDFQNLNIATFGPATAKYFQNKTGKEVDFIGSGFKEDVAQKFEQILEKDRCLFVVGKNSLRSVQKLIQSKNHEEVIVYNNNPLKRFEIENPAIAVFTSPMAVETYFDKYKSRDHTNVAIGATTYSALKKIPKPNSVVSKSPSESGMVEAVRSYLNKL